MRSLACDFAGRVCSSASASSAGSRRASGKIRHQTKRLPSGQLRDTLHAGGEQRRVAAEFVDDEAADQRGILRRDHGLGADQARDHAAAVDIADQHDRHIGGARKAHIGDVVVRAD